MSLPAPEQLVGKLLLGRWCRSHPIEVTSTMLREQQQELVTCFERAGEQTTTRVQIKKIPGIEAVSTDYSLAMVADHLAQVNQGIARLLTDMVADRPCPLSADPALFKPSADAETAKALDDLEVSLGALDLALSDPDAIKRSKRAHVHPWFGSLSATTWGCFPTFHTAIHLKQAGLIVAGLAPAEQNT